jgi:hypothetical protein
MWVVSIVLAIVFAVLCVSALLAFSTRQEERRAQERRRRRAEFDELEPGKMYNPDDYWELRNK